MSQIIKAFTGIFIVLFMMTTATGILGAFLQVSHVQNLHASMIQELENSNYADTVLEECFSVVKECGYELEIVFYGKNGEYFKCESFEAVMENTCEISSAKVTLRFPIKIAFFDIYLKQEVFGYGR